MGRPLPASIADRSVWAAALAALIELPRDVVAGELRVPAKTIAWRLGTYAGAGQRQAQHWCATDLVALARLEEALLGRCAIRAAILRALDGDDEEPATHAARVEGDLARLLGAIGPAVAATGEALRDGRVSADEGRALLALIPELRNALDEAERSLRDRQGGAR